MKLNGYSYMPTDARKVAIPDVNFSDIEIRKTIGYGINFSQMSLGMSPPADPNATQIESFSPIELEQWNKVLFGTGNGKEGCMKEYRASISKFFNDEELRRLEALKLFEAFSKSSDGRQIDEVWSTCMRKYRMNYPSASAAQAELRTHKGEAEYDGNFEIRVAVADATCEKPLSAQRFAGFQSYTK